MSPGRAVTKNEHPCPRVAELAVIRRNIFAVTGTVGFVERVTLLRDQCAVKCCFAVLTSFGYDSEATNRSFRVSPPVVEAWC